MDVQEALSIVNTPFVPRPTDGYEDVEKFFNKQREASEVILSSYNKTSSEKKSSSRNKKTSVPKKNWKKEVCRKESCKCEKFHPTEDCRYFSTDKGCSFGDKCSFKHSSLE